MPITFGPSKSHPSYTTFLMENAPLGDPVLGGYLICRNGGTVWVVAPAATTVSRNWDGRNDAVTTAESNSACGDWFVPTCGQLQTVGYACRTYWDSYLAASYWSSTASSSSSAFHVYMTNGTAASGNKLTSRFVRAFRCVSY